jgi:hypothetical protein
MVSALLLAVGLTDPTAMATAACTRRMAQLAAGYGIVDITTNVASPATTLRYWRYQILLHVTIRYPRETRKAVVACVVTQYGKVVSLEGLTKQ